VWQEARELASNVYQETKVFPASEQFGITNQIRRSVVSIAANIAEGFGRRTKADRTHFYDMARGSLAELQSHLIISVDIKYLAEKSFRTLVEQSVECNKMLTGLINATKDRDSRLATRNSNPA